MSEEIRFIRLRNGDDLVAYTTELPTSIVVRRPIGIQIETIIEMNKQIVTMYEWLSPSVAKYESITLNMEDVLLCLPVQDDFGERYVSMCDILFAPEAYEGRMKPKKKKKTLKEELQEKSNNVVSLFEAAAELLDKKDKPIH